MASYYYLISSLPTLNADKDSNLSYEDFLKQCKNCVNKKVYDSLSNLTLSSQNSAFEKKWTGYYNHLMDVLNQMRREKLGQFHNMNYAQDDAFTVASKAMNAKNPLEAEKILLEAEFNYLDSLVTMHYFDDAVLYGYAIKLLLLKRQNVFNNEEGKKEFSRLFTSIQNQILSI